MRFKAFYIMHCFKIVQEILEPTKIKQESSIRSIRQLMLVELR